MSTSFLPNQLKPVEPTEKPIVHGSNVRHRTSEDLRDAPGIVNSINGSVPGKRLIGVSWKVEGKLLPERPHPEAELENTD